MTTTLKSNRRQAFARELRGALDSTGTSIRSLSRRLNPEQPETARSNLSRYLRGAHLPSRSVRGTLATELGFDSDHFEAALDEADDEEADLSQVLLSAIQAFVRDEARKVTA